MLSKYRNEIFGMAALGVIATHGKTAAYSMPWLQTIFGYGGAGVFLFALLSGMGLYFSFSNNNRGRLSENYRQKIKLLLVSPLC